MSFPIRLNIPATLPNKVNITECIDFLQDAFRLGNFRLLWECPISRKFVGLSLERSQRPAGEYYREPYPMTLQILSPETPGLPQITFPLTDILKQELLSALQIELKK
jgi:hypothetical protein